VKTLPDMKNLDEVVFYEATIIADRNGEELYKMYQENRDYVPIEEVSENMINAIVAVEDKTFWTNEGISFQ
jgi:membrane carboxypeptidase/penicillin-binding protein